MTLKIDVTKADIANAILARQNNEWITLCCPVAQALKRRFTGRHVCVAYHTMWIDETEFRAVHPTVMDAFTTPQYREWPQLKPGSFEITDEFVPPTGITRRLSCSDPFEDEYATQG